MRTLVLGGTRSGKSAYAEGLFPPARAVTYVATASHRPADAEWAGRIAAHQRRRPATWRTLECGDKPAMLPRLVREARDPLLVDDLGGWVTALCDAAEWSRDGVAEPLAELVEALCDCTADVVFVSPEVGLSVVPDNRAARIFADALGTTNRAVADACDGVVLVVVGQPLWIKGTPRSSLPS
jgi:adenosyl cobinamide kinase/adenosyl cobinamide phosphate guanylyltransferase